MYIDYTNRLPPVIRLVVIYKHYGEGLGTIDGGG